ncbi:SGNH/GDSL hydrolase family protein [Mucilaginibacter sp. UR6-1]|uniref:SGNH/GDSL hydrolase family protein n=1 Tax=Mucilaginibacter sp. UR6-1 TaxID=1435643 RepID=UPI001E60727A|nr:SGNH/GDSL hydrolase family protein [Mucilaginibacter sp. UR6-1]MCC8409909.1 SGNH/GDSL hydrolase family protein [Mucilaginibacter sp. UR6-1]
MDISNFVSGVTANISNKTEPKSIPASTVGAAFSELANLTKTAVEAKFDFASGATLITQISGVTASVGSLEYLKALQQSNTDLFSIQDSNGYNALRLTIDGNLLYRNKVTGATDSWNNLKGKNIAFLGDSITTAPRSQDGITANNIYWGLIRDRYGCNVYANGVPGSCIAQKSGVSAFTTDSRWQSLNSTFTPDAVVVFGGTNDFGGQNIPLGTYADSETGKTTFYSALKYLFHSLQDRYKGSKIFFMTPMQRADRGFPSLNVTTGFYMSEFQDAIQKVAKDYGIIIIDTNQNSGFNYYNMVSGGTSPWSPDGLHPNIAGHARLADYVGNILNLHFKQAA